MQLTAILSALDQEQHGLIELLQQPQKVRHAGRVFWLGQLHGQSVVLAIAKIGKVSAAITAAALIEHFGVSRIVFTGVAGGLGAGVHVGDVVVATGFVQHDMNASPLFPRYEVPLYGQTQFASDVALTTVLLQAASAALASCTTVPGAKLHQGLIASGDRFVSAAQESHTLRSALACAGHEALAVEMECAAVAQVCSDYRVAFAAVRTISDRADDTAHVDFATFVEQVASRYTRAVVKQLLFLL